MIQVVQGCQLQSQIGEGTYGFVFKAIDIATGDVVAVKRFKQGLNIDEQEVRKTAIREITLLRQVNHPNIVRLLRGFRHDGQLYLVFEYVQTTVLEQLELRQRFGCAGLHPSHVRTIMWQLVHATAYLHGLEIIHRDIKPENMLLSKDYDLKLCDFGFAREVRDEPFSEYVATRWYRPPELLVGDTHYGKGVDIWAIGCMLVEMATGQALFAGDSDLDQLKIIMKHMHLTKRQQQLLCQHTNGDVRQLASSQRRGLVPLAEQYQRLGGQACPEVVEDFLECCLHPDPEQRTPAAGLLRHAFFREAGLQPPASSKLQQACVSPKRERQDGSGGGRGAKSQLLPPPYPPDRVAATGSAGQTGATLKRRRTALHEATERGADRPPPALPLLPEPQPAASKPADDQRLVLVGTGLGPEPGSIDTCSTAAPGMPMLPRSSYRSSCSGLLGAEPSSEPQMLLLRQNSTLATLKATARRSSVGDTAGAPGPPPAHAPAAADLQRAASTSSHDTLSAVLQIRTGLPPPLAEDRPHAADSQLRGGWRPAESDGDDGAWCLPVSLSIHGGGVAATAAGEVAWPLTERRLSDSASVSARATSTEGAASCRSTALPDKPRPAAVPPLVSESGARQRRRSSDTGEAGSRAAAGKCGERLPPLEAAGSGHRCTASCGSDGVQVTGTALLLPPVAGTSAAAAPVTRAAAEADRAGGWAMARRR